MVNLSVAYISAAKAEQAWNDRDMEREAVARACRYAAARARQEFREC